MVKEKSLVCNVLRRCRTRKCLPAAACPPRLPQSPLTRTCRAHCSCWGTGCAGTLHLRSQCGRSIPLCVCYRCRARDTPTQEHLKHLLAGDSRNGPFHTSAASSQQPSRCFCRKRLCWSPNHRSKRTWPTHISGTQAHQVKFVASCHWRLAMHVWCTSCPHRYVQAGERGALTHRGRHANTMPTAPVGALEIQLRLGHHPTEHIARAKVQELTTEGHCDAPTQQVQDGVEHPGTVALQESHAVSCTRVTCSHMVLRHYSGRYSSCLIY
jgi:hypothetical protein